MHSKWKIGLLMIIVITLINGCVGEKKSLKEPKGESKKESKVAKHSETEAQGKLKVMSYNKDDFHKKYGSHFHKKFPNIKLEVIVLNQKGDMDNYDKEKANELIEKYKPDIIMFDQKGGQQLFFEYIQANKLYRLDEAMEKDNFDLTNYLNGYIDMVRRQGNGSIYGLSPFFTAGNVVYYNADLFKKHGIKPLTNKMTWKEIMETANQFAKKGIVGISYPEIDNLIEQIMETYSYQLFDSKKGKTMVNPEGQEIFKLVIDSLRKGGYLSSIGRMDHTQGGFESEEAAMIIDDFHDGSYVIREDPNGNKVANVKWKFNWDYVSAPIDPKSPLESVRVKMGEMFAISNDSSNKNEAWEFFKFINGLERGKLALKKPEGFPSLHEFPSRKVSKSIFGKSIEPLYMVSPKYLLHSTDTKKIPNEKLRKDAIYKFFNGNPWEKASKLMGEGMDALRKAEKEEKVKKKAS